MIAKHVDYVGSGITSAITAGVALLPAEVLSYAEKLLSVFVLAVAAELGRRLVALLWKEKKK